MKLKTAAGELYLNPQLISHVHLSPDHSLLTVHFVNGTHFGSAAETDVERACAADFLRQLTEQQGYLAVGDEILNLKSALWIAIPDDGPIQVRFGDNRTRSLEGEDPQRFRTALTE